MSKKIEDIQQCRISGSPNLETILYLGEQPLANSLKKNQRENDERFPLTLLFCPDSSLVQLKETVNKDILFSNYVWVTGTAAGTKQYAKTFAQRVIETIKIDTHDFIVEIASNDGTFLKAFQERGFTQVLGIDPAENIAEIANRNGIKTLNRFWDRQLAKEVVSQYGKAKVVIARNVIPHVSEILDVVKGIADCLSEEGIGILEFHDAGHILKELQYDSIYHEHLCYFSIKSMSYLLERFHLMPFHIDTSPISGGSFVIYFSKTKRKPSQALEKFISKEELSGVNSLHFWKEFAARCLENRRRSQEIISQFSGKTVVGFGASARSSTYLNFCNFRISHIRAIIDNNQFKQGFYTPGTAIPIVSSEEGLKMKPDIIFILAWNFRDEIIQLCRGQGFQGEYMVAFPNDPYIAKG